MEIMKKRTEGKVQCELYHQLQLAGLEVWPEIKIITGERYNLRADLAVYHNNELLVLVEVKNKDAGGIVNEEGRQYQKYANLGVPFIYCLGYFQIQDTVEYIKNLI